MILNCAFRCSGKYERLNELKNILRDEDGYRATDRTLGS